MDKDNNLLCGQLEDGPAVGDEILLLDCCQVVQDRVDHLQLLEMVSNITILLD